MSSIINTILDINTLDALIMTTCASVVGIILTGITLCVTKINKDAKTRKIQRRIPGYKPPATHKFNLATNVIITLTIIFLTCMTTLLAACHEATIRTIPYEKLSLRDLPEKIQVTLIEDDIPEDIRNYIIVFYKYGCEDCEAIHRSLNLAQKDNDKLICIASNSEQGKNLRETLPVTDVPCGFYIHSDGSYTNILLYTHDESGPHFDQKAMARLLQLQSEKR